MRRDQIDLINRVLKHGGLPGELMNALANMAHEAEARLPKPDPLWKDQPLIAYVELTVCMSMRLHRYGESDEECTARMEDEHDAIAMATDAIRDLSGNAVPCGFGVTKVGDIQYDGVDEDA